MKSDSNNKIKQHYNLYPYPHYPLFASIAIQDTIHISIESLSSYFYQTTPPLNPSILIAGCGTFSPYPFSISNPKATITALDISESSIKRAKLHAALHLCSNINFISGDIENYALENKKYSFIDAFGVLHHLKNPLNALNSLKNSLAENGIIRIMIYNRYARRDEDSIRRAFKMMKVNNLHKIKEMAAKADKNSRFARYFQAAGETDFDAGIADALLNPSVKTFKIDELMQLIENAELTPLKFAHKNCLNSIEEEIERIKSLEKEKRAEDNFIIYLGKNQKTVIEPQKNSVIYLNRLLEKFICSFAIGDKKILSRFSNENFILDSEEIAFLKSFRDGREKSSLNSEDIEKFFVYRDALFLLEYRY